MLSIESEQQAASDEIGLYYKNRQFQCRYVGDCQRLVRRYDRFVQHAEGKVGPPDGVPVWN